MAAGREVAGSLIGDHEILERGDLRVLVTWVLVTMLADAVNTLVNVPYTPASGGRRLDHRDNGLFLGGSSCLDQYL